MLVEVEIGVEEEGDEGVVDEDGAVVVVGVLLAFVVVV